MMTVVLVVGALVLVAAVIMRLNWRSSGDERHSVNDYHRTLETLRHVSDRGGATAARGQAPTGVTGAGAGPRPPRGAEGPQGPAPDGSADGAVPTPSKAVFELASSPRRYRHVAGSSGRSSKPPRFAPVLLATAMIVVLVALLVFGLTTGSKGRSPNTASHRPPTVASTSASTTARGRSRSTGSTGAESRTSSSVTSRSAGRPASHEHPTRASGSHPVQPTAFTTAEADYSAPVSSYVVSLDATAPCWVLASDPQSGAVVWEGTLEAGQTRQIPAAGSLFLRLGAAFAVTVSLNGEPVVLPTGHGSPFDVTFEAT